jgi:hypothetical protein
MQDRLKILDCRRKALLGLPDGALKVWLCRYMMEDEDNESWASLPEVEAQTGQSHPTCVKWHKYLVEHGWLVDTGKTAHDKLLALGKVPSANAFQVRVYRANDPTSKEIELVEKPINTEVMTPQLKNLTGTPSKEIEHKVYLYDSGSSSGLGSSSLSTSGMVTPLRGCSEKQGLKPEPQTKTQTKTNGSRKPLAPDGSSWTTWNAHDQVWQTTKLVELGLTKPNAAKSVAKKKPGGLAAFLAEGNPLGHGPQYCDDLDCTYCLDGIGSGCTAGKFRESMDKL